MSLTETLRCDAPDPSAGGNVIFHCFTDTPDLVGILTAVGTLAAVLVSLGIAIHGAMSTRQRDRKAERSFVIERYVAGQYKAIRWLIKPDFDAFNAFRIEVQKLRMQFRREETQVAMSAFADEMEKAFGFFYAMTRIEDRAGIADFYNPYADSLLIQHEVLSLALFEYQAGTKTEGQICAAINNATEHCQSARATASVKFPDIDKSEEFKKKLHVLWQYDGYYEGSPIVYGHSQSCCKFESRDDDE